MLKKSYKDLSAQADDRELELRKLNAMFEEKYAELVTKPAARQNASFTKKVAAIGAAAGAIIGTAITFYMKNKQKEKNQ